MLEKKWWHGKTAYQIYPKSFCDSNGDGIGDLKGIISKMDYLKELGIDIVWLSPIYCSPLADQGYDISDYYNIDPLFGTMDDMDELLRQAKARDMYIIMDLVVNHCSDEHEWFKKACEDPDGEYGKYFYIEDVKDGKLPNNWRSYFGGPVWDKLPGHDDKYYMHVFHKKQPDLNWENLVVRQEIYKMINWWLDKGIAGFRIDAIMNIKKPNIYTCYPADREDGLASVENMLHDATGIDEMLHEMRVETFDKHNAFSVGEVFTDREDALRTFIGNDGHFSTMFDFSTQICGKNEDGWYKSQPVICGEEYKQCEFASQKRLGDIGFISNIIENHDEPRGVSHYIPAEDISDTSKKMLAAANIMLRGLPFVYQGQELGMTNVAFTSIDQIDDCSTLDEYQVALNAGLDKEEALKLCIPYSRDNARTPFQWNDKENAGFTTGTPWLMLNPNYTTINAADQMNRDDSVLAWYKELLALRKNPEYKEAVVYGEVVPYKEEQKNLMAYYRKTDSQSLLVIANYQSGAQDVQLPADYKKVIMNNLSSFDVEGDVLHMPGYQVVILAI
jgi:oligo-1,6-glucosidase